MADAQSRAAAHAEPGPSWDEVRGRLDEALAHLGNGTRAAVIGHYLEGLPQAAVASRLGISEEATRKRLQSAREQLRRWFARRGLTVGAGVLAAGLASEAPAAEPLLVHSCVQAGLHPSGTAAALAASGGGALSTAAIAAVLCGVLVAGSALYAVLSPRVQVSDPPPTPAAQAEQPGPLLARQLATRIDVMYRRDFLGEVLSDLDDQVGLDSAVPPALQRGALFSYEATDVTVQAVLERLASEQGLRLAYHHDTVALWKPADDAVIAELTRKTRDTDLGARLEAVYDLGQLADPRIYPPLFASLHDTEDAVVRKALRILDGHARSVRCQRFADIPTDRLIALASSGLGPAQSTDTAEQSSLAIAILGTIRNEKATAWLLANLDSGPRKLRDHIATALGKTRDPSVFPALRFLAHRPDLEDFERDHAAIALCTAGDVSEAPKHFRSTRQDAAEYILMQKYSRLRGPEVISDLYAIAANPQSLSWEVRLAALGLRRNHDRRIHPLLMQHLQGDNSDARDAAAFALSSIRTAEVNGQIWAIYNRTSDSDLRTACRDILASHRDLRVAPALAALLASDSDAERVQAKHLLYNMRDSAVALTVLAHHFNAPSSAAFNLVEDWHDALTEQAIIDQLSNPRDEARTSASYLVSAFGSGAALHAMLKSADAHQRYAAARKLTELGDPRALATLTSMINDTSAPYYGELFWALCNTQDPRAEEALLMMLDDNHIAFGRLHSSQTCMIGRPRIRDRLLQLLRDQRADVRVAAASSLVFLGASAVGADLRDHLSTADWMLLSQQVDATTLATFLEASTKQRETKVLSPRDAGQTEAPSPNTTPHLF